VWSKTAQSRLAELWLESKDQARFTSAANRIDQLLAADPARHAQALGPRSYVLEIPPLVVAFSLSVPDQKVVVEDIKELGSLDS